MVYDWKMYEYEILRDIRSKLMMKNCFGSRVKYIYTFLQERGNSDTIYCEINVQTSCPEIEEWGHDQKDDIDLLEPFDKMSGPRQLVTGQKLYPYRVL